ncbi:FG-GAP repeat domain-containing protein [Streptomyces sp. NPDC048603]|uniref:FG-GAP repeat domain-containing protein n=1 Tax=Streptomyces sp. NPDC048603 TaxID=3365577 RepID=UPI003715272C
MRPVRHHRGIRHGALAATVLATLATTVPLAAAPATAADGFPGYWESVTPPLPLQQPRPVYAATDAGYLLDGDTVGSYVWRAYGQTAAQPVTLPAAGLRPYRAGRHTVAFHAPDPAKVTTVHLRDMRNGSTVTINRPEGHTFLGVYGDAVLTSTTGGPTLTLHWLTVEQGGQRDRTVTTTVPAATKVQAASGNTHGALLGLGYYYDRLWVDHSGEVREAPHGSEVKGEWLVKQEQLGSYEYDFVLWDLKGPWGPENKKVVRDPETGERGSTVVAVIGTDIVYQDEGDRLRAIPLAGGSYRSLLDAGIDRQSVVLADGRLVATSTQGGAWGAYVIAPGADGKAAAAKSANVPLPLPKIHAMTMANGELSVVQSYRGRGPDGPPELCTPDGRCGVMNATGDGKVVYRGATELMSSGKRYPGAKPATQDGVQVSGRFAAYVPAGDATRPVEVYDLDRKAKNRTLPTLGGTFALAGAWVWREKSAGVLEATDVRTGKVMRTDTVAGCDIKALEAWATSVYWKCDKDTGVYDTGTKKNVKLPAHNSARLGNGYVAWEAGGVLRFTDLRGSWGTRDVGKPVDQAAGRGWTVDRYTHKLVYVDAGGSTHRVTPAMAPPDLATVDADVPTTWDLVKQGDWKATWWLNQPITPWTLTIKDKAGKQVYTYKSYDEDGSDNNVRGRLTATWHGGGAGWGAAVPNGTYTWTISASPVEFAAGMTKTGTVTISGTPPRRSYSPAGGNGSPSLLAATPTGELKNEVITLDAKGNPNVWSRSFGNWPAGTTFVPFGDLDTDRCNEVLVRDAKGNLRAYDSCYGFSQESASRLIGPGWGQYDVLSHPGDLTGDNRPDLIARQAVTGDLFLYASNASGGFGDRVRIGAKWKNYTQIAGAGDLTGDGVGDVVTVDKANTMWVHQGVKNGSLKAPVQLNAAGWAGGRNAVIGVGDINRDGRPDLLSRNSAGDLLVNLAKGGTALGPTTKLAGGYAKHRLY